MRAGIDQALRLLKTDYIDIVHLHSCPIGTLQWGEPLRALEDGVRDHKIRVAAYSGENEALEWSVESGRFGSVEHSINICDQRVIDNYFRTDKSKKARCHRQTPGGKLPWRFAECPVSHYAEEYWWRWKTMDVDPKGLDWQEVALRFAAFTPGVHSCIVGTTNAEHLKKNLAIIEKGPLPQTLYDTIRTAFKANDPGWWIGQV